MANPVVAVTGKTVYTAEQTVEAVAGDTGVSVTFPAAVPVGKKAVIRVRVYADVVDAT